LPVCQYAFITPIVKKAGFDPTEACYYRPISNVPVLSKLLERLVVRQLMNYLTSSDLAPPLQSGFSPGHSTESAVLHVPLAVDRSYLHSAAFDTVDYNILLQRLQTSYGINGSALQCSDFYGVRGLWAHLVLRRERWDASLIASITKIVTTWT